MEKATLLIKSVLKNKKEQPTCSRKCSYKLISIKNYKSSEYVCPVCSEIFTRSPSQIKSKHNYIFCSKECQYKGRTLGLTKRIVEKPYQYTPETKQKQIDTAHKPKGRRVFYWKTCTNCGKSYDDQHGWRTNKTDTYFCSLDCCNSYRVGDKNPAWRGGYKTYYGKDWRPLQRATRKRDQYTCQRCGQHQKDIGQQLDVHHIIPISSFIIPNDANTLENVISLCHSCHMFVEWHGLDFICETHPSYFLIPFRKIISNTIWHNMDIHKFR